MATEKISTSIIADDAVTTAKVADDAVTTALIADDQITGALLANDISISTTGNIATTGSGTLTVAGASTFSGGIANSGTITAGTIGSGVTITDGANPHGWEHIKTISYSADTATAQKMSNVVSSTYSVYKLIIQWGSDDSNRDLFFRFLDSSDNEISTTDYAYGGHGVGETGTEGVRFSSTASTYAKIANDALTGSRGFNAEITLYNCFASSSDFPQIDGYQLTSTDTSNRTGQPHAFYQSAGHDAGDFDLGVFGFFWLGSGVKYVSGFQLTWSSDTNVSKGSFWSCYGLKLPTAD